MKRLIAVSAVTIITSANAYTVTTTTTTTTSANGTVNSQTTRSAPYDAARCATLRADLNIYTQELPRTAGKVEIDRVRALIMTIQQELADRGC
ncbi:hypothetical protein [Ralstonia pseudosolanacearum]|uniref:Uncharacterized protein n=1 Tax=Ralstonia solanacearum TaxID=305 RepID=A0AA92IDP3_RALSL|nr:hypothetical protein [Ralstonia pseudosolanacearum]QCX48945.1 hypothetical protein E7Z57_07385 [Ralstonia pseudosolanacearum]